MQLLIKFLITAVILGILGTIDDTASRTFTTGNYFNNAPLYLSVIVCVVLVGINVLGVMGIVRLWKTKKLW